MTRQLMKIHGSRDQVKAINFAVFGYAQAHAFTTSLHATPGEVEINMNCDNKKLIALGNLILDLART